MESTRLRVAKKKAHQYLKEGDLERAWTWITEVTNIDMDDPQGLYMAGVFFRNRGHSGLAAQMFRRCVALDPNKLNPWLFFGACLHDMHHYDAALEIFTRCRQMAPQEPVVFANMAASYHQMGDFHQALNYSNEALKRNPEHPTAHCVRAMALLGLGRWREGFTDYKWLYGQQLVVRTYGDPDQPEWDGTAGKVVVIQGDQGLGDEVMYSSVLPDLVKDCKKVILDCHPKLVNVFKRSFSDIDVYGTRKEKEGVEWVDKYKIDARYHISGLGRFYRVKDKDFPRKPYLVPNKELRLKWREKLKDLPKPWVGLTWQGGSVGTMREFRSLEIGDWQPLLDKPGTFVDLSYHDSTKEVEGKNIVRFDINQADYDDTLALLAELDLVISVTTTVVHACGAIGKDAFVLVNKNPQWRYGSTREDMQWYGKSIRLFRQGKDEEGFAEVVSRIVRAYEDYLGGKSICGV